MGVSTNSTAYEPVTAFPTQKERVPLIYGNGHAKTNPCCLRTFFVLSSAAVALVRVIYHVVKLIFKYLSELCCQKEDAHTFQTSSTGSTDKISEAFNCSPSSKESNLEKQAISFFGQHQFDKALRTYEKLNALCPAYSLNDPGRFMRFARKYVKSDVVKQGAVRDVERNRQLIIVLLEKVSVQSLLLFKDEVWDDLADVYFKENNLPQAIAILEKIRLNFDRKESYLAKIAKKYLELGQPDEAKQTLNKRNCFADFDSYVLHIEIAEFYEEIGRFQEALDTITEMIDLMIINNVQFYYPQFLDNLTTIKLRLELTLRHLG